MANTFTTTVSLRGAPVSRPFALLMKYKGGFEVAGHGQSDENGSVTVKVTRYKPGCQYFAMALDNYGSNFEPTAVVSVGDIISPSVPAGISYKVTGSGQLPASEPVWPEGFSPFQLGSAIVEPLKVLAPSVYGPIPLDITVDEHWDKVSLLLIMEGVPGAGATITDLSPYKDPLMDWSNKQYQLGGNPFDVDLGALKFTGVSGNRLWFESRPSLSFNTDATMEIWFTPQESGWDIGSSDNEGIVSRRNGGSSTYNADWRLTRYAGIVQFVVYQTDGGNLDIRFNVSEIPAGQTHYLAVCRRGNLFSVWLNGKNMGEETFSGIYKPSVSDHYGRLAFGEDYSGRYFTGIIHSFRFTHGVARYSGPTIKVPDTNFYSGV